MTRKYFFALITAAILSGVLLAQLDENVGPTDCGRVVVATEDIQNAAENMIKEGCIELHFSQTVRGYWFASGRTVRPN